MRFEILELVEQYGPICPVCVCESTSASRAEVEGTVHAGEQLEFMDGCCGRCHKHTPTLISAKPTLASRLKQIAGEVAFGPFGMFGLLGWAVSPRGRRRMADAYKKVGEALTSTVQHTHQSPLQPITSSPQSQILVPVAPATAEELDGERRSLIKKLNAIDHDHRRDEPLGKRIQRLRSSGKLSSDVANAMRQITRLRNLAVYDEYVLVAQDNEILRAARTCLENWSRSLAPLCYHR